MGLLKTLQNIFTGKPDPPVSRIELVSEYGDGFIGWNGKLYKSDIVRACIRPKTQAIGKMTARHILERDGEIRYDPEPYMRILLQEPNPYMTGQMLQEKLTNQLALNGNAFAIIIRNEDGMPMEIFPVSAISAEALYGEDGRLYLKFFYVNGNTNIVPYSDVIHLRRDFYERDIFGASQAEALTDIMESLTTLDEGVNKAIKNSGIIKWIMRLNSAARDEDVKKKVKNFADSYLSVDSETMGVVGASAEADVEQVKPYDILPNKTLLDAQKARVYAFFNTNEAIVTSSFTDEQWNAYYESEIAPLVIQFSQEWTRKLFTPRQRAYGNRIDFHAMNLQCASLNTKLNYQAMVDRGAMTVNEWRATLGLPPIEGGDIPIRRLDTQPTLDGKTTLNQVFAALGLPKVEGGDVPLRKGVKTNGKSKSSRIGDPKQL